MKKCGVEPTWKMDTFIENEIEKIKAQVGNGCCIGAISGGVDSSVCAALVRRALGDRFHPFMVDTGLLRKNEAAEVKARLEKEIDGFKLEVIDERAEGRHRARDQAQDHRPALRRAVRSRGPEVESPTEQLPSSRDLVP